MLLLDHITDHSTLCVNVYTETRQQPGTARKIASPTSQNNQAFPLDYQNVTMWAIRNEPLVEIQVPPLFTLLFF